MEICIGERLKASAITKVISIFSFFLMLFCLYVIDQSPGVRGYEISIYDEYPTYLWYLVIFCILSFQIVLFLSVFPGTDRSISWKAACIGMALLNSILLFIPLIRRYAIYGSGDPATHMGYMLDILQTGQINLNMYPIIHILGVIYHLICGFNLNISMFIIPTIFYILYAMSFYMLFKITFNSENLSCIGMMLAILLYGSYSNNNIMFFPQGQSNSFIPFVLYLFFSRFLVDKGAEHTILLLISAFFITFFHPLTCLVIIFIFCIYELSHRIIKYYKADINLDNKSSFNIIAIMLVVFFMWQSYARVFLGSFFRVFMWLYENSEESSMFEHYSEKISDFSPDISFLISGFIYKYGLWLLLMLMGIISVLIMLKIQSDKNHFLETHYIPVSIMIIIFFIIYVSSQFMVQGTGYSRVGYNAVIFSILLIPTAIWHIIINKQNPRRALYIITFLLLISCINYLTVFTLYMAPISKSSGQHLSDSQLIGVNTFFEKRCEELKIIEGGVFVYRIKDALYGKSTKLKNVEVRKNESIPFHFGYTESNNFGDLYEESLYVVISSRLKIVYPNIFPEYPDTWKFNQKDFCMLENDDSVSKIYTNNEISIYLL